jgi:hypothetical protein
MVFSQTPCVSDYQINNGGGNCPVLNLTSATGTVTLSFNGIVDPQNIPTIAAVYENSDPLNPVLIADVDFGTGTLLNNGNVKYCYYVGPNNNNNLQGRNSVFKFIISYNGAPCGGDQGALPVSFRAFSALRNNSVVELKWTTATESNNLGFEIQRMIVAGKWQTVSFIASQATGGNSSLDLTYTYSDLNATKGVSQYRIRQVDIDNRSKLSEIRAVRGQFQLAKTIVYPNPSTDGNVNVVFDEKDAIRDVSLVDVNGRLIRQWKNIKTNILQVENLTVGFYSLCIVNTETGEQSVEKIVIKSR